MPVFQQIRRRIRRGLFVSLLALPLLTHLASFSASAAAAPIALGVYTPSAPGDASKLDNYSNMVGATPAIVMWYQDWAHGEDSAFPITSMNTVASRGAMPLVTWEPWNYANGVDQSNFSLRAIAAGQQDAYISQWARDAATWGKPFYIRFAHEADGTWYPWSIGVNGNSSADYIAAWQHVVTLFRQAGATNARWVWCVNVLYPGATPISQIYPGDAWVDWVAVDGYNWGNTQDWSTWQSLTDVFSESYNALAALTSKPQMIAEVGSTEAGGNKANWITQGFLTDLAKRMPNVRAVIWFNENKELDWRVNSTAATIDAFKKVATSAQFKGRLP